jgi:hypothetical protein
VRRSTCLRKFPNVQLHCSYMISLASHQNPKHQGIQSHVHGLLELVAASPAKIAPERVEELKALVVKHDLIVRISDRGEINFEMGAMYGQVFTSMRTYHHLWSAALYFAAIYIERDAAARRGETEIDLTTPEIEYVWANYRLSCECFKDRKEYPLPPNATIITSRSDYIELADDLFLGMVAFCHLHEIAHLENGDSKTDEAGPALNQIDPLQVEYSADKWAYDWILSRWDQLSTNPKFFIKRALGVIFSLAMMDEFRHHSDDAHSSSHPDACDRLIQFFSDYDSQIRSNQWGASCFTAAFVALQGIAAINDYLLPTTGFTNTIDFLKFVKEEGPRLREEAKARKAEYAVDPNQLA